MRFRKFMTLAALLALVNWNLPQLAYAHGGGGGGHGGGGGGFGGGHGGGFGGGHMGGFGGGHMGGFGGGQPANKAIPLGRGAAAPVAPAGVMNEGLDQLKDKAEPNRSGVRNRAELEFKKLDEYRATPAPNRAGFSPNPSSEPRVPTAARQSDR